MEQRLRLVQGGSPGREEHVERPACVAVPGQIVWKDARGATRMAAVVTRDVSEHGVSVDCLGGMPIPLFRLVYFQLDREARNRTDLPAALRKSSVLSADLPRRPDAARRPARRRIRPAHARGAERQRPPAPSHGRRKPELATADLGSALARRKDMEASAAEDRSDDVLRIERWDVRATVR